MTTLLKEMRIAQLSSSNERTLADHLLVFQIFNSFKICLKYFSNKNSQKQPLCLLQKKHESAWCASVASLQLNWLPLRLKTIAQPLKPLRKLCFCFTAFTYLLITVSSAMWLRFSCIITSQGGLALSLSLKSTCCAF